MGGDDPPAPRKPRPRLHLPPDPRLAVSAEEGAGDREVPAEGRDDRLLEGIRSSPAEGRADRNAAIAAKPWRFSPAVADRVGAVPEQLV